MKRFFAGLMLASMLVVFGCDQGTTKTTPKKDDKAKPAAGADAKGADAKPADTKPAEGK